MELNFIGASFFGKADFGAEIVLGGVIFPVVPELIDLLVGSFGIVVGEDEVFDVGLVGVFNGNVHGGVSPAFEIGVFFWSVLGIVQDGVGILEKADPALILLIDDVLNFFEFIGVDVVFAFEVVEVGFGVASEDQ